MARNEERMNPTRLQSRCAWLAGQLRSEAQRWSGAKANDLKRASAQVALAGQSAHVESATASAWLDEATNRLVLAMKLRASQALPSIDPESEWIETWIARGQHEASA